MKKRSTSRWSGGKYKTYNFHFDQKGRKVFHRPEPDEKEKETFRRLTPEEIENYRLALLRDGKWNPVYLKKRNDESQGAIGAFSCW